MTGTIKVDLSLIEGLRDDLKKLYDGFDGVPDSADEINDHLGSSVVKDAVSEFSSNWKIRRGRLLESIDAVHKMAADAHTSFTHADLELANQILGKK